MPEILYGFRSVFAKRLNAFPAFCKFWRNLICKKINNMNSIETFISEDVFLAHCWSTCTGSSPYSNLCLLEKIKNVMTIRPEISCSTIKKGDTINYDSNTGPNNFWGPIGVIIKPGTIVLANPKDAGSPSANTNNPIEIPSCKLLTAIKNRSQFEYNEIRCCQYECIGLFYCLDDILFLKAVIPNCFQFYNFTKKFNVKYYQLSKGLLKEVKFDSSDNLFHLVNNTNNTNVSIDNLYN
jgi:hypothetical protein